MRIIGKPREETTDDDVAAVRRLYEELGSIEFARREADRLVQEAAEAVERLPVDDRHFFRRLTEYMVSRTK